MAFNPFKKLVRGLTRTREGIASALKAVAGSAVVDDAAIDDLEASLLAADLGPGLTMEVIDAVRAEAAKTTLDGEGLRRLVQRRLSELLDVGEESADDGRPAGVPRVVFVVGVNGGGKTTTIGKLALREKSSGAGVLIAAADTFRAAAIEQVERWAERAGVSVVKHKEGADPAAVVFDALRAARERGIDTVLVDTAGRLHTKAPLMAELAKLTRVAGKEVPGAPHEVLLVLDATTGQNGLAQARQFTEAANVSGVVLTKLDGTAKGGVALGIRRELGVPIRYVGVGEGVDDLLPFDAESFLEGLLGGAAA